MGRKKSNESRTYMRVPVTFYEEVKKGAKEAGVSIPDYLIGKVVVDKSTPIPKEGAK